MIPAAAAALVARFAGAPPSTTTGQNEAALVRIRELETERNAWMRACERCDEENERLRIAIRDLRAERDG